MSTRYDDRDSERGRRNYGGRSGREDDRSRERSYGQSNQGWGSSFDDESQRYSTESRWRGQYGSGGSRPFREGGEYQSASGHGYGGQSSEEERDYSSERNRGYGGSGRGYGGGGGSDWRYRDRSTSSYGQGANYPAGFGFGERYDEDERRSSEYGREGSGSRYGSSGRGGYGMGGYGASGYGGTGYGRGEYDRGEYGRGEYGRGGYGRGEYDRGEYGRGEYGQGEERGWWDRASDAIASWFGDEEAERRRNMDAQRPYRGRGPKGYRRSDERIKEDVNDRLSEGYIDATEIEVNVVGGEVTLTGTVNSRMDKRRAEDIAEYVSGVTHVENRLRVKDNSGRWGTSETGSMSTGTMGTGTSGTGTSATGTSGTDTSTTGTTGTTGTGTGTGTSTGGTSTTARGRSASS